MTLKTLRISIRALSSLPRGTSHKFLIAISFSLVSAAFESLSVLTIKPLIAILQGNYSSTTDYLELPFLESIQPIFFATEHIAFVAISLTWTASVFLRVLNLKLSYSVGASISIAANKITYRRVLGKNIDWHSSRKKSDLVALNTLYIGQYQGLINSIIILVTSSILLVVLAMALIASNPRALTLLIAIFSSFYLVIGYLTKNLLVKNSRRVSRAQSALLSTLNSSLTELRNIKASSLEPLFTEKLNQSSKDIYHSGSSNAFISSSPRILLDALLFTMFILFIFTNNSSLGTVDTFSTLGVFGYGAQRLVPAFQQIFFNRSNILNLSSGSAHIIDILEEEKLSPRSDQSSRANSYAFYDGTNEVILKLRNVSYKYQDSNQSIISNLSCSIPYNSTVSIQGSSGSGKSTLLDIICGFATPTNGQVMINSKYIPNTKMDIRKKPYTQFSIVSQFGRLFPDSILQNITIGSSNANIDHVRLHKVLQTCQLEELISNLPDRLDTFISDSNDNLSGGQIQRILLARAMYRESVFLVLDEATSALDKKTEALILKSYLADSDLFRTTLIISHSPEVQALASQTIEL